MGCGCGKNKVQQENAYTVEDLRTYLPYFECVRDNMLFETVGMTEELVLNRINMLEVAIEDKVAHPNSYDYSNSIPNIITDVNYIALNTNC